MAKHSQHKHIGTNSKKAQRVARAKVRRILFEVLTPDEKLKQITVNKAKYNSQHYS